MGELNEMSNYYAQSVLANYNYYTNTRLIDM